MLQVFEDAENGVVGEEELLKILKLIQSYVWRRFIVGLPTNALNKIFMTLYSEVDTEEYYESIAKALLKKRGSAKFPHDEEIKAALKDKDLYNTQPKNRNYLFEMLENYNNREFVDTRNELITIEHIFPQTPCEEWVNDITSEDYFQLKEKYLNTIANLTLSGNNGALGNRTFREKKEMNISNNEQGYNYSRLWLNSYLKSIDQWTISEFKKRLEIIFDRFIKIWELPQIDITDMDETEEQNIFDAENPTHKKLDYFIFENTKIEEQAVAQMYFFVIRKLFDKNTQLLIGNQDILKINKNISDFRNAQEITNGWYVEANMDSNSKFSILKKLLALFELEDELLIKYASSNEVKSEPNRFNVRKKYWQQLLPLVVDTNLFDKVNPSKDHWLSTGAGVSGLMFTLIITKSHVRIELGILSSNKERNKSYFRKLLRDKDVIEAAFGKPLDWEELPDNKMSRIKYELEGLNLFNEHDWDRMNLFFIQNLSKFESSFRPYINKLK